MEDKFAPTAPLFKGDGVGVWKSTTKGGKPYLIIRLVGHNTIYAFKNEPTLAEQVRIKEEFVDDDV